MKVIEFYWNYKYLKICKFKNWFDIYIPFNDYIPLFYFRITSYIIMIQFLKYYKHKKLK